VTTAQDPIALRTLIGVSPRVDALKSGAVSSPIVTLDFANVMPVTDGFPAMVRDQAYDFGELAIVTFLQAKIAGKPLVLLPAVVVGQYLHDTLIYNSDKGPLDPKDLAGKTVGVRSFTQTTGLWVRGVLEDDYGVPTSAIDWITFQEPHVLEFREPAFVRRAPKDKALLQMLLDGEIDAAIGAGPKVKDHPQLKTVIPDAPSVAADWGRRRGLTPINHMAVVSSKLRETRPDVVREVFRMLDESKKAAPPLAAGAIDANPFGVEPNRKSLEQVIDYALRQELIPRRLEVDELFDDLTRSLGA
jgi:4,5-dihydroxyphthalate decarboxylase